MSVMRAAITITVSLLVVASAPMALAVQFINGWEVYTEEDGLSSNQVESIWITDQGLKWFGVSGKLTNPLNVFDDKRWWTLDADTVYDIKSDPSGDVWALECMNGPRRFKNGVFEAPPCGSPPDVPLATFDFDIHGTVWVGVGYGSTIANNDLSNLPIGGGWRYFHNWNDTGDPARLFDLEVGLDGTVWVGWQDGVIRSRDQGRSWTYLRRGQGEWCYDVEVAPNGDVWVASSDGVFRSMDGGESWVKLWTEGCFCMTLVEDQGIFFGSLSCAFWYDYDSWLSIDAWQGNVAFSKIAVDPRTGDVWFATWGDGVGVLRGWFAQSLPAIVLGLATDQRQYSLDDAMRVSLDLVAEGEARTVDLYVALEMPSEDMVFCPSLGLEMAPFISGVEIPADTHIEGYELFTVTLPELPAGTYRWYAACTYTGTMDFASNVASCEWQFE